MDCSPILILYGDVSGELPQRYERASYWGLPSNSTASMVTLTWSVESPGKSVKIRKDVAL
jgi:hypothetical protein